MTTRQPQPWGAPPPRRPRQAWSTRRIVAAAAIAVVIVGGGTAAVFAATGNGNTSTGNGPGGRFGGPGGPGGPGGGFGMDGGLERALHGDFVVADGTTERLQNGTVTAVSATGITVRSSDGYTRTYTVDGKTVVDRGADTIGEVANGNTVTVIATVSGSTATATTIEDSSIDSRSGRGAGPGRPPGD